ncbi:accessory gene regulator B family protein [Paenibacillus abyssi]|uniref:accessory gene regulator B family protein n=1 Tax=Paenibacillus abyssi TaxID=1340531 RepID=UPI00166A0C18|nr:accessory gene regulator B family protein [Paenibacillus abyssi]
MIDAISNKIAVGIKSKVPEHPASVAVLQYSISLFINTASIIGFSIVVSIFTGRISEALVALISFAALRQVSGGIHLKSGMMCIFVSTAGITLISFAEFSSTITMLLNIAAFFLALLFAPSRIEKQTRINSKYFPLLKVISALMIVISFFIGYSVLAAALFTQTLTLIKRGR